MSCYRLIEAERTSLPIQFMCPMLGGVSRSGYYDWRDGPPSRRSRENVALTERIRQIYQRSCQTYDGSLRECIAELGSLGTRCSKKRVVARLMRDAGLRGSACV